MKIKYLLSLCCVMIMSLPVFSTTVSKDSASLPHVVLQTNETLTRINEIKSMDKSNLSSSEKKSLRKELREIKRKARATNGGLYLSVGAIIIIILLLILLL